MEKAFLRSVFFSYMKRLVIDGYSTRRIGVGCQESVDLRFSRFPFLHLSCQMREGPKGVFFSEMMLLHCSKKVVPNKMPKTSSKTFSNSQDMSVLVGGHTSLNWLQDVHFVAGFLKTSCVVWSNFLISRLIYRTRCFEWQT